MRHYLKLPPELSVSWPALLASHGFLLTDIDRSSWPNGMYAGEHTPDQLSFDCSWSHSNAQISLCSHFNREFSITLLSTTFRRKIWKRNRKVEELSEAVHELLFTKGAVLWPDTGRDR